MSKFFLLAIAFSCTLGLSAQTISFTGGTPARFCTGGSIVLTASNPSTGTFQWQTAATFGGPYSNVGGNSNSLTVSTPGFYTVREAGTAAPYDTVQVFENPKPVAGFTFTNNNACSGTAVQFTSTVTTGTAPFTYAWTFGDGNTSTVANPSHSFTSLGCGTAPFNVRLIVIDANGCRDTADNVVTVIQRPDVRLSDPDIFSPFSNCDQNPTPANPNFTLTVNNTSPSAGCITSYNINWGDGNSQTGVTFPLTHTYTQLGAFNLVVTAFGANGCNSSQTYVVGNQTNPAGGLATLGATTGLCAPSTIPFIITNWENNSPGTIYRLDFGDGVIQTLTHPLNATGTPHTVNHPYQRSSCPQATFTAVLQVINACDTTPYTAGNIQVRISPVASFTATPNPGCAGNNICFLNTTIVGSTGPNCLPTTAWLWNFGDPASGSNNTSTAENPCHIFSSPGVYTVTLTSTNPCGSTTATQQVCITAPVTPAFTINNATGCAPLAVTTSNTTNSVNNCAPTTWLWSVSYAATNCGISAGWNFTNGTTATSQNAQFLFNNPGTYTITLQSTNPCGSATTVRTVVVKQPPTVTLPIFAATCGTASISPVATVANCGSSAETYAWSFPGGTPLNSTSAIPGTINYATPGTYTITLDVTNECGTTTVTRQLTVNPVPNLTVPASTAFCVGETAGPLNFTSTPAGATFAWTNSNPAIGLAAAGTGNIPAFVATNIAASPITGNIFVTASNGLCTSQQSFAITVNPRPAAPIAPSPINYCQNAPAVALTATATAGNTLLWYTLPTGGTGSSTAPIPSTAALGTTVYYVSQVNSSTNCEGNRTAINVTVRAVPVLSNITSINPSTCGASSGSITLTVTPVSQPYIVHYLRNGVPVTVSLSANASGIIVISNLNAGLYSDFYVELNGCSSNLMGPVTLSDPSQPATPVATSNGPLCSGSTLNLSATSATAGATFSWTGPNGFTATGPNPGITNVTTAASGTYLVTATLNNCISAPGTVVVVINPTPVMPVVSNSSPLCAGSALNLFASTTTSGAITYAWTGPGSYSSVQQNPVIPNAGLADNGTYTVIATATTNGQACPSAPASTIVLIKPVPQISDSSFTDPTNCASSTGTIMLRGLTPNILFSVNFTKNGIPQTPVNITASTTGELVITGLTQGTYSNIFVVLNGCSSNVAGPFTLTDPTAPATATVTGNGPLCSGNTILLTATTTTPGAATYSWTGPGGFSSSVPNPSIPNATVANSGNYLVTVTINSCTSAPASVNVLVNQTPVVPTVTSNSPVCTGNTLNFTSASSTAGAMTYAWTGPNGFTSSLQNPSLSNVTLADAGTYSVVYTAVTGSCASGAGSTVVIINPTPVILSGIPTNPSSCGSATGNIKLTGLTAGATYTVNFTLNGAPQSISATANGTGVLTIPALTSGTYDNIMVLLSGCTSNIIGPIILTDPNPPAAPNVSSNAPLCAGQTLNLFATPTSPGLATFVWTGPNGFNSTQQNPVLTNVGASNAGYYYVTNTIANCISLPDSVLVVVNPLAALPIVSSPVNYCIGTTATALTATASAGNSLNWYTVATGGTALGAAPIPSTTVAGTTSYYVSETTGFGCEGPRAQIDVIINPDARAVFVPVDTMKCAPFAISSADVGLQQFPASNASYDWYANGIFIGSGTTFPGYTISNIDDSVTIKLKTISLFGCKADSMSRKFYTFKVPAPSFTMSDTVGCGPLSIAFTNTTPEIGLYNYSWDFGNGQTSTLQQPGTILFPINPTYNDTVYTIQLKVTSICDTVIFERQVRVKAPPRALFTPSRTTGCSPMKVLFTNTSLALNNTYYWDFGDGTTLVTTSRDTFTYVFTTGVVDTFTVQLIAVNDCGSDTIRYLIVAAPNNIRLNYSVNGPDNFGCAAHTVAFVNNSSGASNFEWNFGDGNSLSTTDNIDTVYHTYANAGTYAVSLQAINTCTDTTAFKSITVYPKPTAAFISSAYNVCIGQSIQLTNQSQNATSYAWDFGDGNTSVLVNPSHTYTASGPFNIRLISFRNNPSGDVCIDTAFTQVMVRDTLPGFFTMSDSVSNCAPLTVTFVNRNRPSVSAVWNFGDGNTATGDSVVHRFALPGTFYVNLLVTVPGGCTYMSQDTVNVFGPSGSFVYDHGFVCDSTAVRFTAVASNANSYTWNFGDGNSTTTASNIVYHSYANPGSYVPSVSLQNPGGCSFLIQGLDTIKVDKITAGYSWASQQRCGSTAVQFADTSFAFFGIATTTWRFGDGTIGSGSAINHIYTASNLYNVEMIVTANSGCADTVETPVNIEVNSIPIASIIGDTERCANQRVTFSANVVSTDPISVQQWTMSNGVTATGPSFSYLFNLPGTYNVTFVSGTTEGCFDTAFHTIVVRPVPFITATNNLTLCLGNSAQLNVTGAANYQWTPSQGLSCTNCPNPVASPIITTPYVVTASNAFGCTASDSVVVTVIQPMNLTVSPNDSICIGESANLLATGATTYAWNPAATLSSTTVANPVATPTITTSYRVVGYDGFNCFTDTAFVVVAVGRYPTVNLGPDLVLATGTLHPLPTVVTNGPIAQWLWTPAQDLNCANCPLPMATIKKDVRYVVKVTTAYGCSATDTMNIKVFCEDSQVFVPNAFTPDGDGVNDVLMVRGRGIVSVKFFRVFNRWGELVFERSNFPPNVPSFGWNGKVKGVTATPDVFVYTAEVICENGTTYVYKGNTSILK